MRIYAGKIRVTHEVAVFLVSNMTVCCGIVVYLRNTKVVQVDYVAVLASEAHNEIVGRNFAMNHVAGMDVLDARDLQVDMNNVGR